MQKSVAVDKQQTGQPVLTGNLFEKFQEHGDFTKREKTGNVRERHLFTERG